MRIAVAAAAALWIGLVAPADAADVSATRAYKLCWLEDPLCVRTVMDAYRRVAPRLVLNGPPLSESEQRCLGQFKQLPPGDVIEIYMNLGGSRGAMYFLEGSVVDAMERMMSSQVGLHCRDRMRSAPPPAPEPERPTGPTDMQIEG